MLKDTKLLTKNQTNFKKGLRQADIVYKHYVKSGEITKIELTNMNKIKKIWNKMQEELPVEDVFIFHYVILRGHGATDIFKAYGHNLKSIESVKELNERNKKTLLELMEKFKEELI